MFFFKSVFFFQLHQNVNLKIPKINFLALTSSFRKFGIKLPMKTYLTVLFKGYRSVGAHSDWIFQNYRFSQFAICNSVQVFFQFLISLVYSKIPEFSISALKISFLMNYSFMTLEVKIAESIKLASWNICE